MSYQVEVLERQAQPALSLRATTSLQALPQVMGQALGAIAHYLVGLGEHPAGPPFAAYYNMDMQALDVEVGFPVAQPLPGHDAIHASQLPGGKAVACVHVGPYAQISGAYQALSGWLQTHGQTSTGVAYELYLNDPQQTPPEALQTQVLFPIR